MCNIFYKPWFMQGTKTYISKKKSFVVKFWIYKSYPTLLESTIMALSCPAVDKSVST